MNIDEKYMFRVLELAKMGLGKVSPNPLVASLIVYEDKIVGEGYHKKFGGKHAEIIAIESVKDKSILKKAKLYVNLEPCVHKGKTPPCSSQIIECKIPQVIIATEDPNPVVFTKGIKMLLNAGIKIKNAVLKKKAISLNRRFFTFQKKERPYIILKWAQSIDNFIAPKNFKGQFIISCKHSRNLVHLWRSQEDAIMIGYNTAINDNPSLTVRHCYGRNPVRVIYDKNLSLSQNLKIFNNQAKTIVFNTLKNKEDNNNNIFIKIENIENPFEEIFYNLYKHNIASVIVEGGSKLINKLIKQNFWDEARVFTSTKALFDGIPAPAIIPYNANKIICEKYKSGEDILNIYYNNEFITNI